MKTRGGWLLLLACLCCYSASSQAQVQYRSSSLFYTPAIDLGTGYTTNGTGYMVSQTFVASPPQPTINQPYYVSVTMHGIAAPAAGRLMAVHFVPPSGTSVVVDSGIPVRCFYRAMSGTGGYTEFTNTVLTDVSFNANLRVFGCPQPANSGNPYTIVTLPNNNGTAYFLDRRDPQSPGSINWPMGSYAAYEFFIPVISNRTMDGSSQGDRFYAPVQSIQGDGNDPWVYPYLSLLVHPAGAGPVADMATETLQVPPPIGGGKVGNHVVCRNLGPSPASDAQCGFANVPSGYNHTISCTPTVPQASLAVNATITCWITMNKFVGGITVQGVTSSATSDPNLTNNSLSRVISGGLVEKIFESGFE